MPQKCIGSIHLDLVTPPTVLRMILWKLYKSFLDGLKICMCFFQNPDIIFVTFFAF